MNARAADSVAFFKIAFQLASQLNLDPSSKPAELLARDGEAATMHHKACARAISELQLPGS